MRTSLQTLVSMCALLTVLWGCQSTPAPVVDSFIKATDGKLLHYRMIGSGPDVLVVPGESWLAEDLERLARGRTVVFYDPRSRGKSDPSVKASLGVDLEDLATVCDWLELERFSLLAVDYQCALASLYAAQNPERVENLVLISPIPIRKDPYWLIYKRIYDDREAAEGVFEHLNRLRRENLPRTDPEAWSLAYRNAVLAGWVRDTRSLDRMQGTPFGKRNPDQMVLQYFDVLRQLGNWDWRTAVGAIASPTLIVLGDSDPVPAESNREWQTAISGARSVTIKNSGRLPWIENSRSFYDVVEPFLE